MGNNVQCGCVGVKRLRNPPVLHRGKEPGGSRPPQATCSTLWQGAALTLRPPPSHLQRKPEPPNALYCVPYTQGGMRDVFMTRTGAQTSPMLTASFFNARFSFEAL